MIKFRGKKARTVPASEQRSLARLEFEMALQVSDAGVLPPSDTLRKAADSAGGDLVVMLPETSGEGVTAVVRLVEGGQSHFLQVRTAATGFAVVDEGEIDASLLGFARASVDVLERLKADRAVTAPLSAAAH